MSIIQALIGSFSNVLGAVYRVLHSLRFDGSGDYLVNTLTTTGNRKTFTYSCWVKRSTQDRYDYLFASTTSTTTEATLRIGVDASTDNLLGFYQRSGSYAWKVKTTSTITDTEWHHVVLAVDTNQTTDADKVKIYLDGSLTTHDGASTYMATGADTNVNLSGNDHGVGGEASWGEVEGQLAEVHFIDGTAYGASYFGATRGGQWVPKEVTGLTYGTNGFYLPFDRRTEGVTLLVRGDTVTDLSGNQTLINNGVTAGAVASKYSSGGSLLFDGGSDYIDVGNVDVLDLTGGDWTIECWVKPGELAAENYQVIASYGGGVQPAVWGGDGHEWTLMYDGSAAFFQFYNGSSVTNVTASHSMSTSNWYHIAATRENGTIKLFVDGSQIAQSTTVPAQASGAVKVVIGDTASFDTPFQGNIEDFRITKGIARDIAAGFSSGTPITNGGWDVSLTNDIQYGSLGRDASTNTNNFTVNGNITPDDQLIDSPNLRFATWDPDTLTHASGNGDLTESNLKWVGTVGNDTVFASEAKSSGKWYYEAYLNSNAAQAVLGWSTTAERDVTSPIVSAQSAYFITAGIRKTNTTVVWGSTLGNDGQSVTIADNDVFGFAIDISSGTLDIYRNGTLITSPALTLPSNKGTEFLPIIGDASSTDPTITANFGQDHTFAGALAPLATPYSDDDLNGEFRYQPPAGFKALATSY